MTDFDVYDYLIRLDPQTQADLLGIVCPCPGCRDNDPDCPCEGCVAERLNDSESS